MTEKPITIDIPIYGRSVSGVILKPRSAWLFYVFGHGAGAGMKHSFMDTVARGLYDRGVATMRYQFPYIEDGKSRPDIPKLLETTSEAAIRAGEKYAKAIPLIAGGKSMGGRITSQTVATRELPVVRGIAFFGFPLHAPGREGTARAKHLSDVAVPMLFLQGTRDKLAELGSMRTVAKDLGRLARLHVLDGADHSFHVLKRSGRSDEEVLTEAMNALATWGKKFVVK